MTDSNRSDVLPAGAAAELILRNGRITTMDPSQSFAAAVAVRDGSIAGVGADQDVLRLQGPAIQVIDLEDTSP